MAAQGLQFTEIVGDVFTRDPHDSMATCVSNEFKMSKSLAKQFKDTFKGVDELKAQTNNTPLMVYTFVHKGKDESL
ncbi:ADP-ribose glycohydrolase OARD1-like isoform X2 [Littorina saxatilis]|uniref:ADP-ribose glycohydrolase OARD1-like isoform X2 n=1 Tax=Littorina saxatilis TaxID=31220 RepID=UPI0038B4FFEC